MRTERFFTYFPPPQFLSMNAVGLDISDEAIRFIELVPGRKGFELGRFGERSLPKGAVEDGYINNQSLVIDLLKELKKEHKLSYVRVALPEEKVYLFKTEVPQAEDRREIQIAIESRLEENVPLAPSQVIFDFEIADGQEASVSALPEKVVTTYLEVCTAAGLTPVDFETEGSAIRRALVKKGTVGTSMIVNFAQRKTGVFIVSGGILRFSSTLSIGGEALASMLAKDSSVPREEAALPTLSALKDEINRILTYWRTHEEKQKTIDTIILTGENSTLAGLDKYLTVSLSIAVEQANPWANAFDFSHYIPKIDAAKALAFAVPIGLALGSIETNV